MAARYEYALTSPTGQSQEFLVPLLQSAPLDSIVSRLHASIPAATSIRAAGWSSGGGGGAVSPPHIHVTFSVPTAGTNYRAQVLAALPSNVAAEINAGRLRLDGRVFETDFTGDMGAPSGAGWRMTWGASWSAPSGGGTTTTPPPPAAYDRCATGASEIPFTAYRDEWGPLSGSNVVTVPRLTAIKVLGRARRTISGPSDNRLIQIELRTGPMAGQKVWVVSDPAGTARLRSGGCTTVDTYAPDARPNPNTSPTAGGSASNPTPAPPPTPLPPVQPAQSAAGGDLAAWIVVGSLAGAGYLVWDKMKRRRR